MKDAAPVKKSPALGSGALKDRYPGKGGVGTQKRGTIALLTGGGGGKKWKEGDHLRRELQRRGTFPKKRLAS